MYSPKEISDLLIEAATQTEDEDGRVVLTFSNGEAITFSFEEWEAYDRSLEVDWDLQRDELAFDDDHYIGDLSLDTEPD